jgi:zinc ribbon protein
MFCPNCGSERVAAQRFCRSCGLRLDTIDQVVRQELKESKVQPVTRSWLRIIFLTAWHYGLFLLALGMTITGVAKKIVNEQLIADIGSLISVLGVGLLVSRGILLLKDAAHSGSPEPPKAETTTELTPHQLEAKEQPSVTEFTTHHLDPVYAKRKDPEASEGRSK